MQFKLPDLGEGVHEGQIVRVHVKEGDSIREDEPLLEVETDKAAVEIPSPFTGVVTKVHVEEQQLVHVGDVMIEVNAEGATAAPAEAKAAADVTTVPTPVSVATAAPTAPAGATRGAKRASPAVRRLARTTGIDLAMVAGTGAGGRVTPRRRRGCRQWHGAARGSDANGAAGAWRSRRTGATPTADECPSRHAARHHGQRPVRRDRAPAHVAGPAHDRARDGRVVDDDSPRHGHARLRRHAARPAATRLRVAGEL